MQPNKKRLAKICRDRQDQAEAAARAIGRLRELPLLETQSAALLREALTAGGFSIERGFPQMPTAFVASYGSGGPVIGLLAEYDALPDCGPGGKGPGHGCGHNLLGTAGTYAAIAVAQLLAEAGLPGTIKLFGTPAEETLVGKVYMARDGAFDGLDACLAWHPGAASRVDVGGGTAMDSLTYEFFGRTAHAAGNPHEGRSALDAVEIMNVAVNFLREHVPSNVRMHYAIMDGGKAPNVVPPYARSWYFIRGRDREQVAAVSERVDKCARAAALATETKMKRTILAACYNRLGNDAIAGVLDANLRLVGAPQFDDSDREAAKALGASGDLDDKIGDIKTEQGSGSSDEGNVSWITPLGVLNVACSSRGTPGHHYLVHEESLAPAAMKGLRVAVQTLAFSAWDLLTDPAVLKEAKEEFARKTEGRPYDPVIPARQRPPLQDRIPPR